MTIIRGKNELGKVRMCQLRESSRAGYYCIRSRRVPAATATTKADLCHTYQKSH